MPVRLGQGSTEAVLIRLLCKNEQRAMSFVEVICCRGAFGIVRSEMEFSFRIYPDGSTMIDIASPGLSDSDLSIAQQQQQHENDPLWYGVIDSIAHSSNATDDDQANGRIYAIEFSVVSWDHDLAHGAEMCCTGQISSHEGICGNFAEADDIPSVLAPFRLLPVPERSYTEPLRVQFFPLTPGEYRLDGCKVAEIGILSGVRVCLELFADGTLRGDVREKIYGSEFPLMGTWSRDQVQITRHHNTEDLDDCYEYEGTCALSGLRGTWKHRFMELADDPEEFGVFDFQVIEAKRVWSPPVHCDYPQPFQECTRLLLLSTLRAPHCAPRSLPNALWLRVLSFCDYSWFGSDVFRMSEQQD